ncbi:MAG: hypothetical protein QOE70_1562 [Chthoniobacter sp.]|jgi:hypothetical protein|nr:hypothetical protein [Chthoniobacter sp.]
MKRRDFLLTIAASLAPGVTTHAADAEPLRLTHTIPLPGVKGRFDHFACDAAARRLIVAALGNNTGEVFDVAEFKRLHSITGLRKPTGALMLTEPHRFYFANGDDGTFRAFDTTTNAPASQLSGLDDADNVRFDASAKLIYIGFGEGALGVTDPTTSKLLHSISLAAHPEAFQLENHGPRIFVNVPEKRHIAVVDREKRKVVATWPMEKAQANFPMALDEPAHRLFVGCRKPARLVVFDTARGVSVTDLGISGDTDDLFLDAKRQRLYVSCGEGFLDVIQRGDGDHYERIARITTRAGARTCFFSPELDHLFLAVPEHSGHDAELRGYQPE